MKTQWVPKDGQAYRPVPYRHSIRAGIFMLYVPEDFDGSILISKGNPYGYALNISHPRVAAWYARFKAEKHLPVMFPISDEERFEFETRILRALNIEYKIIEEGDNHKEKQPA